VCKVPCNHCSPLAVSHAAVSGCSHAACSAFNCVRQSQESPICHVVHIKHPVAARHCITRRECGRRAEEREQDAVRWAVVVQRARSEQRKHHLHEPADAVPERSGLSGGGKSEQMKSPMTHADTRGTAGQSSHVVCGGSAQALHGAREQALRALLQQLQQSQTMANNSAAHGGLQAPVAASMQKM
jgi:hypothetical protein